ncbi:MAG: hypothetical protein P4L31_08520, partial [Candidatus Babeliales bacterium]|nr:hypothetical protein [Candidatus Babeliales bacterium]
MISITYKQVRKIFLSSCMIFMWHADTHAMLPQQGQNFQQVLADIGTDVDALLTCCSTTFTALGGLSPLIMADFNNTMTAIAGVSSLITTDFNNTMTALAALSALETNNVNQTFTALAAISALITQDFNATMTAIAGVSRLVTTGFNNTFTAIAGVSSLITTDFNATMTALAALSPLIIADFNSTFTVLAALSACNPIPLSQTNVNGGQGILLTTTGASYCLSQNITGSIIISAADITVDLNMHSLLGTIDIISTATNATIKNGNIKPVAPG